MRDISNFTDFFFICQGNSTKQTQAIGDAIEEKLTQNSIRCNHTEGYQQGDWILMDYIDFIVHIFTEEKRAYFNLERLWGDAEKVRIPPEKKAPASKRSKVSNKEKSPTT